MNYIPGLCFDYYDDIPVFTLSTQQFYPAFHCSILDTVWLDL